MSDSILNEREQAFENKFAHDQEIDFLSKTRGGALFAEWIASLLKLSGDEASRYTHQMLELIVMGHSPDAVLARVTDELFLAGHKVTRRTLEARMAEFQANARRSLY